LALKTGFQFRVIWLLPGVIVTPVTGPVTAAPPEPEELEPHALKAMGAANMAIATAAAAKICLTSLPIIIYPQNEIKKH
jgi:hypothetical protein